MDVLAGRKTAGVITGDVRLQGHPVEQRAFSRIMGCEYGSSCCERQCSAAGGAHAAPTRVCMQCCASTPT